MRIALLSPISWRTPPRHYGPWKAVVSLISEPDMRNVVLFPTTFDGRSDDGTVKIYWGGADSVMCVGTAKIAELVQLCRISDRPPLSLPAVRMRVA